MSRILLSLARKLIFAAPLALATIPVSAAPITILSANCSADNGVALASDPLNCASSTSEGHVANYLQSFYNGFTISLFANGTAWASGSQSGAFTLDDVVPINLTIDGPSRNLVVYLDSGSGQTETLNTSPDTVGQVRYGFNNFTVISRNLNGGDPVSFDFNLLSATSNLENWTTDEISGHNFGLSMQLSGTVTDGSLFGSMSETETLRFFEADGVTPVQVLVSDAPEPASLLLLLGGIPVCYLVARRRRSGQSVRS